MISIKYLNFSTHVILLWYQFIAYMKVDNTKFLDHFTGEIENFHFLYRLPVYLSLYLLFDYYVAISQ